MSRVGGRVAPVLVLLLSLVLVGCSLVPGGASPTPVDPTPAASPSGPSPQVWESVGTGWMVVLLNSTRVLGTELVLVSPEGTQHQLSYLPAGTELLGATLRAEQVLLAQPAKTPGRKTLTVISPRKGTSHTLPGEYDQARFFRTGEAELLLRRAGAPAWELADLAGATVTPLPQLTSDRVVSHDVRDLILGTNPAAGEFVLIDATNFGNNAPRVAVGRWDAQVQDCAPFAMHRGWGQFVCGTKSDAEAIVAMFEPDVRTAYWPLDLTAQQGQALSAHQFGAQGMVSRQVECGGSVLYATDDIGGAELPGFDGTTEPIILQETGALVLIHPTCGGPATQIELRDYEGAAKLLYRPAAGWTIQAAAVMSTQL